MLGADRRLALRDLLLVGHVSESSLSDILTVFADEEVYNGNDVLDMGIKSRGHLIDALCQKGVAARDCNCVKNLTRAMVRHLEEAAAAAAAAASPASVQAGPLEHLEVVGVRLVAEDGIACKRQAGEAGDAPLQARQMSKRSRATTASKGGPPIAAVVEESLALTVEHAVVDSNRDLVNAYYMNFVRLFDEYSSELRPMNKSDRPGTNRDEMIPDGCYPWDDRLRVPKSGRTPDDSKWGAGWISKGKQTRWFNIRRWGSWRFTFLLARLQCAVWMRHVGGLDRVPPHSDCDGGVGEAVARRGRRTGSACLAARPLQVVVPSETTVPRSPGPPDVPLDTTTCAGPLRAFFAATEFAQNLLSQLEDTGFAVLRGVLSACEADAALDRMWDFVEAVNPVVHRDDAATWFPQGRMDPWPHRFRDMMQVHQAGWVFGDVREMLAHRIFEPLFGRRELHCSKDGFCFQRPTRVPLKRREIDHFDQRGVWTGLHCVQASVALIDQDLDDGCFLCWPGSHRFHGKVTPAEHRQDWYILSDSDKADLNRAGCTQQRVPVRRGDMVLWRSDLAHAGASPSGIREGFRAVIYATMLPSEFTPEHLYERKRAAYDRLETGSHWPSKEEWFVHRGPHRGLKPRKFFEVPPPLSRRLQELYGLRRYGDTDTLQDEHHESQDIAGDDAPTFLF